jgi:hypothetical protein
MTITRARGSWPSSPGPPWPGASTPSTGPEGSAGVSEDDVLTDLDRFSGIAR